MLVLVRICDTVKLDQIMLESGIFLDFFKLKIAVFKSRGCVGINIWIL
jgi:hypothetical protein